MKKILYVIAALLLLSLIPRGYDIYEDYRQTKEYNKFIETLTELTEIYDSLGITTETIQSNPTDF